MFSVHLDTVCEVWQSVRWILKIESTCRGLRQEIVQIPQLYIATIDRRNNYSWRSAAPHFTRLRTRIMAKNCFSYITLLRIPKVGFIFVNSQLFLPSETPSWWNWIRRCSSWQFGEAKSRWEHGADYHLTLQFHCQKRADGATWSVSLITGHVILSEWRRGVEFSWALLIEFVWTTEGMKVQSTPPWWNIHELFFFSSNILGN